MSLHRIRLRGPWKLEWTSGEKVSSQKVHLPADWNELFDALCGPVRLTRTFHRPTNLGPKDEVDLVLEQWPGAWAIRLNQRLVAEFQDSFPDSPKRIRITPLLGPTNLLSAESQIESAANEKIRRGLLGKTVLEIRDD